MFNISIREIEYIITVAECGNITRAADKLFISQPALSQTIKRIENELGIQLFQRFRSRLTLTDEGKCFVSTGIRINKELRDMENHIQDISFLNGGTLALGIPHHLGAYIVPKALAVFKQQHEKVDILLREASPNTLEEMLKNGMIDLAIMPLPIKDSNICYKPFLIDKMVLVMGKNDPLNVYAYTKSISCNRRYFDLKNADGATFILGELGQRIRIASDHIISKSKISAKMSFSSINVETIKRLVGAGLGLTLLPELYFRTSSERLGGDINCYNLEPEQDYPWTIVAAYYKTSALTVAARCFMDILDEVLVAR